MKDLSNVPTSELLTEWQSLTALIKDPNYAVATIDKEPREYRFQCIVFELDSRTVGMNLMDGMPEISINHVSILKQMTLPPKPVAVRFNISLDELIERLKWLKLKPNV